MAVKSFIRGDFRGLIIDNDNQTKYRVYFNNRWNYIQDEDSFINRLSYGESYLYRFNLKILDNGNWINLALLDNYYNADERKNCIFYRAITKENFNYKDRGINFAETNARLGLNNLQNPFASNKMQYNNENIEEVSAFLKSDEIMYSLGNTLRFNEIFTLKYNLNNYENLTIGDIDFIENYAEITGYRILKDKIYTVENSDIITSEKISKFKDYSAIGDFIIRDTQKILSINNDNLNNYNIGQEVELNSSFACLTPHKKYNINKIYTNSATAQICTSGIEQNNSCCSLKDNN